MANTDDIYGQIQSLGPSSFIELFELDLTPIGGSAILRFCSGADIVNGSLVPVTFKGQVYQSWPVAFKGSEVSGTSSLPQPTLTLSNVNVPNPDGSLGTGALVQALVTYDDLRGAVVRRHRTFSDFLDNQPGHLATNRELSMDTYIVDEKPVDNGETIQFKLVTPIDQQGVLIPGRIVSSLYCQKRYRSWNSATNSWNMPVVGCTYSGSGMWDGNDNPTTDPTKDQCSRQYSGCKLRFSAYLPTWAFPGAGKLSPQG